MITSADCVLQVVVLDIRFPTLPVAELQRHQAPVNALAWAPHSSCHICTAGDDAQALIWDLSSMGKPLESGLGELSCRLCIGLLLLASVSSWGLCAFLVSQILCVWQACVAPRDVCMRSVVRCGVIFGVLARRLLHHVLSLHSGKSTMPAGKPQIHLRQTCTQAVTAIMS